MIGRTHFRIFLAAWSAILFSIASGAAAQDAPPPLDPISDSATESEAILEQFPEWRGDPTAYMVAIEILVVEVDEKRSRELGVKYGVTNLDGSGFEGADAAFGPRFSLAQVPTFTGDNLGRTSVGFVPRLPGLGASLVGMDAGGAVFSARLRALLEQGEARIQSRPVVLALHGTEATIRVGSEVPYQDVKVNGGREELAVAFEDVGVELKIVPEILDLATRTVRLDVRQIEVSSVSAFITIREVDRPVFDTANTRTVLTLRGGETLQMSSLKGRRERKVREGIPVLMHIPLLGWLFSSYETTYESVDILFFVTPHVVAPGKNLLVPYDFAHGQDLIEQGVQGFQLPMF